jgi:hypothetical protein
MGMPGEPCSVDPMVLPLLVVVVEVLAPARTPATIKVPRRKVRDFFIVFLLKGWETIPHLNSMFSCCSKAKVAL